VVDADGAGVNRPPTTAAHSGGAPGSATDNPTAAELLVGLAAFEDTSAYNLDAALARAVETERIAEALGETAVVMRSRAAISRCPGRTPTSATWRHSWTTPCARCNCSTTTRRPGCGWVVW
jgi:hypothetical protein